MIPKSYFVNIMVYIVKRLQQEISYPVHRKYYKKRAVPPRVKSQPGRSSSLYIQDI